MKLKFIFKIIVFLLSLNMFCSEKVTIAIITGRETGINNATFAMLELGLENKVSTLISSSALAFSLKSNKSKVLDLFSGSNYKFYEVSKSDFKEKYYLFLSEADLNLDIFNLQNLIEIQSFDGLENNSEWKTEILDFNLLSKIFKNDKDGPGLYIFLGGHGMMLKNHKALNLFKVVEAKGKVLGIDWITLKEDELLNVERFVITERSDLLVTKFNLNVPSERLHEIKYEILGYLKDLRELHRVLEKYFKNQIDASIAGLKPTSFLELLKFFRDNTNTKAIVVESCYVGNVASVANYLNQQSPNTGLKNEAFPFDIIYMSSDNRMAWSLSLFNVYPILDYLKTGDDKYIKNILIKRKYFEKVLSQPPIIRPKNQSRWFSLFVDYEKPNEFNLYTITTIKDQTMLANKKPFVIQQPAAVILDTPCIYNKIILEGKDAKLYETRIINRSGQALYFEDFELNLSLLNRICFPLDPYKNFKIFEKMLRIFYLDEESKSEEPRFRFSDKLLIKTLTINCGGIRRLILKNFIFYPVKKMVSPSIEKRNLIVLFYNEHNKKINLLELSLESLKKEKTKISILVNKLFNNYEDFYKSVENIEYLRHALAEYGGFINSGPKYFNLICPPKIDFSVIAESIKK